jgi:hypothetical protein
MKAEAVEQKPKYPLLKNAPIDIDVIKQGDFKEDEIGNHFEDLREF